MTHPIPQWTFGDRVRKVRRELHLSQAELAQRLSETLGPTSTSTVGAWESSMNEPSDQVATARALEKVTGIPAAWFLGLHQEE